MLSFGIGTKTGVFNPSKTAITSLNFIVIMFGSENLSLNSYVIYSRKGFRVVKKYFKVNSKGEI